MSAAAPIGPAVDEDHRAIRVDLLAERRRPAVDASRGPRRSGPRWPVASATPAAARTFWSRSAGIRPRRRGRPIPSSNAVAPAVRLAGGRRHRLLREPRGDVDVERRQLLEARHPEPLEELEAGAVEERPAGRIGPAQLHDEPAVEQGADRVVRVDAADPLDRRLRHRLAVGDDRERLERRRRRRTASAPTYRATARRPPARSPARPGPPDHESRMPRPRRETSRSPSRSSTVARSTPAIDAISRRDSGRSATNSSASSWPRSARRAPRRRRLGPSASSAARVDRGRRRRSRERLQRFVDRRPRRQPDTGARAPRPSSPGDDRAPRLVLLDDDLAPLHQLEHRQERDRDHDPIADALRAGPGARSSARSRSACADDRRALGRG